MIFVWKILCVAMYQVSFVGIETTSKSELRSTPKNRWDDTVLEIGLKIRWSENVEHERDVR